MRLTLCLLLLLVTGCFQSYGPTAWALRDLDMDYRHETTEDVHFVEQGRRATGLLVDASRGASSPFAASSSTVIVPMLPTALAGPVWLGKKPDHEQAMAMVNLPNFRHTFLLHLQGHLVRARLGTDAVWIVSTHPFVLAICDGKPLRSWREYEKLIANRTSPSSFGPNDNCEARLIIDEELDQPITQLAVLPDNFWAERQAGRGFDTQMSIVTLDQPLTLTAALDVLTRRPPNELGAAKVVSLYQSFPTELDGLKAMKAERDRLRDQ